jgi:acyl-coenzyme A thioesterase PaaI-like protein
MSYFLPVVEGRLSAHARVIRRGRATAHLECDLEDGEGRLVARASSVCAIRQAG